jgi:hypothetical protein
VASDSKCRDCWLYSTANYFGDYNGDGRFEVLFLRSGAGNNHWFLGTINNNQLICNEITGNGVGFADLRYTLRFQGRFSRSDREEILFYYPGDDNWWLGTVAGSANQFNWVLVGNTKGFGHGINDGRPFKTGDFNGDGRTDVMFYYPGDGNWWQGTVANNQLNWKLWYKTTRNYFAYRTFIGRFSNPVRHDILINVVGNWYLFFDDGLNMQSKVVSNTAGFGDISNLPTYIGDFDGDGKEDVLFYYGGDGHWWLGPYDGNKIQWKLVSESAGFGNISTLPTYVGNMDGDNKSDVLFYYGGDGHWWLGPYDGNKIQWKLVSESAGFGNITSLLTPKWYADFNGDRKTEILFYYGGDGHWWLGPYDGNKIQWTLVAADVIPPPPPPPPQIVKLTLARTLNIPDATHTGALYGPGKVKSVKNLEQFGWWLNHEDTQNPPRWVDSKLEAGQVKTTPWAGMYVNGAYKGNYGGSGPIPNYLTAEIEIQS